MEVRPQKSHELGASDRFDVQTARERIKADQRCQAD